MVRCSDASDCINAGRCLLGICVYTADKTNESPNNTLILPMVGAILHDLRSLRQIYLFVFIFLASLGLISNIFSFITFVRDRIRFTINGIYLIIFSICGMIMMMLLLTNIITALRYDEPLFRLWACHGYPYLFVVISNASILMSAAIAIEDILNRCFSFDRFRSRKCAITVSFNLFALVLISNLDKIFARHLILDSAGHFSCTYEDPSYPYSFYINNLTPYIYMIISCIIHSVCILFILFKIKQQRQKWYQKIFAYKEILFPSFCMLLCLCPYVVFRYLFSSYITLSNRSYLRLHIGFILLVTLPQTLTFFIYILPNKYYRNEFQQSWIGRILFCNCFTNKQRQKQEFEVLHLLWPRKTSSETVMTISSLNDSYVDSALYDKVKLEI